MSTHDALPGDLYVDAEGKLWRVISICGEPTVTVQEVESAPHTDPLRRSGGVSGCMWQGFKRIHRPDPPKPNVMKRQVGPTSLDY